MKKIVHFAPVKFILRMFFSMFYSRKYLTGKFFDKKVMGWFWALRGLRGRVLGENSKTPWPVHPRTIVSGSEKIHFQVDSIYVFQVPGCYWQARDAHIYIGSNCHIAPNVGIITTNHDVNEPNKHAPGEDIVIGDNCWIAMNAVVLPGVTLGNNTVVAAGAVVTKSFPDGHCVIGGVPAKVIKRLNTDECAGN